MSERTPLPVASGLSKTSLPGPPPRRPSSTSRPNLTTAPAPPTRLLSVPDIGEATSSSVPSRPKTEPARKSQSSKVASTGTKETSISLPVEIKEKWRAAAKERGTTMVEVVLTAIEHAGDSLRDLVAAERPAPTKAAGLFPDRAAPATGHVGRTIAPLETTQANLDVLDRLAKETGATSRSQLITAALRGYLADNGGEDVGG